MVGDIYTHTRVCADSRRMVVLLMYFFSYDLDKSYSLEVIYTIVYISLLSWKQWWIFFFYLYFIYFFIQTSLRARHRQIKKTYISNRVLFFVKLWNNNFDIIYLFIYFIFLFFLFLFSSTDNFIISWLVFEIQRCLTYHARHLVSRYPVMKNSVFMVTRFITQSGVNVCKYLLFFPKQIIS